MVGQAKKTQKMVTRSPLEIVDMESQCWGDPCEAREEETMLQAIKETGYRQSYGVILQPAVEKVGEQHKIQPIVAEEHVDFYLDVIEALIAKADKLMDISGA